jgi:hypothetical protein
MFPPALNQALSYELIMQLPSQTAEDEEAHNPSD